MRTEPDLPAPLRPNEFSRPVRAFIWIVRAPFVAAAIALYFALDLVSGLLTRLLRLGATLALIAAIGMAGMLAYHGDSRLASYLPALATFGAGVAAMAAAHYFIVFLNWLAPR